MGLIQNVVCDCGCGVTVPDGQAKREGWFQLGQGMSVGYSLPLNAPKIRSTCYFKSLLCLQAWVARAVVSHAQMVEDTRGLEPRGTFESADAHGLSI